MKWGRVGVKYICHICVPVLSYDQYFQNQMSMYILCSMIWSEREVFVCFVDIGGIDNINFVNFIFKRFLRIHLYSCNSLCEVASYRHWLFSSRHWCKKSAIFYMITDLLRTIVTAKPEVFAKNYFYCHFNLLNKVRYVLSVCQCFDNM